MVVKLSELIHNQAGLFKGVKRARKMSPLVFKSGSVSAKLFLIRIDILRCIDETESTRPKKC